MVRLQQYMSTPSDSSSSSSPTSPLPSNLPPPPPSSPEFHCYYYYDYNYPCYYYPFPNQHPYSTVYLYPPTAPPLLPVVVLHPHHHLLPPQPPVPSSSGGYGCRKPFYKRRNHGFQNDNRMIKKKGKEKGNEITGRFQHATTVNGSGSQLQTPPPPSQPSSLQLANCTTVMVKNIPNTLRRRELINMLDHHCRQQNSKAAANPFPFQYDFLYLPFDFVHQQNLGYAFVNFTTVEGAVSLHNFWSGRGWESCDKSPKIREITPAKLQGLERCKKHFEVSIFHCRSEEYLPVEFSPPRDGLNGDVSKTIIVGTLAYRGNAAPPKTKLGNAVIDVPKPKPANAVIATRPKPRLVIAAPTKPSWFKHQRVVPPRLYRRSHLHSRFRD